ncbi:hypothetical protein BX616_011231 [Lobosporangium transversale]|uniref:Uncharacterized protein n=1 Tax=Lobosporangium transversale TaxID=64571 RepID=A0A1Y2GAH8_9FUNG|nr:hypothetical protein BCR41DRAFT_362686 [Lobosporangium transversale]KAF9917814.1 hypothetical protein BX616_011231 [Lobosporangium transversale]ORZ04590.1 hypothetical protein BCR41DRAFT_362686 [Lobosporangium transversale]|eukprot:XP_021876636.1 hypothetical protein BCR41DRAFT_362686 [Lobosporangium transversale]
MLRQITRNLSRPTGYIRTFSSARSIEDPSVNYRPGKEGFAPGMPHPPGTTSSPHPPPEPRTTDSLPEMSKKHQIKANGTPEQKYKLEMTKLRHTYQREYLEEQSVERVETQRQRKGSLRRLQERQAKDRLENERRIAFERLMQPNGEIAASGPDRQAQVAEFVKARKIKRQANYQQAEARASEKRLDAMIQLYHSADNFVTIENLDAKVNEFYETGLTLQSKVYLSDVQDMVADVMENGGQVSYANLLKREQELKDALDGTVSGGKIGYESVKAKVDSTSV